MIMHNNNKGFTLVEMVVAMGIFVVIIAMSGYGFERVLNSSSQQARSAQSNFEGVVGLEMMRYDLDHAGYALPYGFQNFTGGANIKFKNLGATPNKELAVAPNVPVAGMDSTSLNAVQTDNIQAFSAGSSTKEVNGSTSTNAKGGPDYLVVRSTISALDNSARKWNYVAYTNSTSANLSALQLWQTADDLTSADRFITVSSTFDSAGTEKRLLLQDGTDNFEVSLSNSGALPAGDHFRPSTQGEVVTAYGVRSATLSALRMPYNRTDYYVSRPVDNMPKHCNPGTGILYKAMVDHATGGFDAAYPLLDCIGDLQMEFEYDPNDDGNFSYLTPTALTALTANEIRSHLKNVRVYILSHEGKLDKGFKYPADSIQVGDSRRPASSGRTLTSTDMSTLFTPDWRNYRWKIYTIVTRPKNLAQ